MAGEYRADLRGATLGILGLGRLGSQVAQLGMAFGMSVQAWSQNLTPDRCSEEGVSYALKDDFSQLLISYPFTLNYLTGSKV